MEFASNGFDLVHILTNTLGADYVPKEGYLGGVELALLPFLRIIGSQLVSPVLVIPDSHEWCNRGVDKDVIDVCDDEPFQEVPQCIINQGLKY